MNGKIIGGLLLFLFLVSGCGDRGADRLVTTGAGEDLQQRKNLLVTAFDGSEGEGSESSYPTLSTYSRHGSASAVLSAEPGTPAFVEVSGEWFLTPSDRILLWVYLPKKHNDCSVRLALKQQEEFFYSYRTAPFDIGWSGWTALEVKASDLSVYGSPDLAAPITAIELKLVARSEPVQMYADAVLVNSFGPPTVIWTFDDGNMSDYTSAYSYLSTVGQAGTSFVVSSYIGTKGHLNLEQMLEMAAGGWEFGNHTEHHGYLPDLAPADALLELENNRIWLTDNGLSRAANYLSYPGNGFVGVEDVVRSAGVIAARTSQKALVEMGTGIPNALRLPNGLSLRGDVSVDQAKAIVDQTIAEGKACIIMGHGLDETDPAPINWKNEDFRRLVDYVEERRRLGQLEVLTFREWFIKTSTL